MSQQVAIDAIQSGKNVFVTGGAGVGKSHVINQVSDDKSVLVAPTGVAALNIGGSTCHSVFGLPFGLVTDKDMTTIKPSLREIFGKDGATRLILEEISMCRADYLDLIDHKLRMVKGNSEPFGGIQVVCVGDGFQLPPIITNGEMKHFRRKYKSPYWFDSKVWKEGGFTPVLLEKVYRQEDEQQIALLNSIRVKDKNWQVAVQRLNEWCTAPHSEDVLSLCNYNKDADVINKKFYSECTGKERFYKGIKTGKFKAGDCIVEEDLYLKEGCKVVICANGEGYVNGQRGTVESFDSEGVVVAIEDGGTVLVEPYKWERVSYSKLMGSLTKVVEGSMTQIPLKLGWAISVHKAQGMTLDGCRVDLGERSFSDHQTYVALSRVRDLKNISLARPVREDDIMVSEKVRRFYELLSTDRVSKENKL